MAKTKKHGKTIKGMVFRILETQLSKAVDEVVGYASITLASRVVISEYDNSYNNINKMLHKLSPEKYQLYRIPDARFDCYDLIPGTKYMINLKNKNIAYVTCHIKDRNSYSEKTLEIAFIGPDRKRYKEKFITEAIKTTDTNHIYIRMMTGKYGFSFDSLNHSFDHIILEEKEKLIRSMQTWSESTQWYKDHQLVHKIGVLLYGQPGTGKSTIAKAIADLFPNTQIIIADASNMDDAVSRIISIRKRTTGYLVILMEDFDMLFSNREEQKEKGKDTDGGDEKKLPIVNQNTAFQMLDGILSTEGTIYIATTNCIESIDPAMIRCGRFDIQMELKYFTKDQAVQFVNQLGYNEDILNGFAIEYPVQPAMLQSMIMDYRAKELYMK